MWSNDIKCKYMFMFPQKNLAHKRGMNGDASIFFHAYAFENVAKQISLKAFSAKLCPFCPM